MSTWHYTKYMSIPLSVSHEDFIRAWQTSNNVEEVRKKTGMTYAQLSSRRGHLRHKGVPLKKFFRITKGQDWAALIQLAKDLESKP